MLVRQVPVSLRQFIIRCDQLAVLLRERSVRLTQGSFAFLQCRVERTNAQCMQRRGEDLVVACSEAP